MAAKILTVTVRRIEDFLVGGNRSIRRGIPAAKTTVVYLLAESRKPKAES